MSVLEATPYSYLQGDAIYARITAFNSYGPGEESEVNTGGAALRTKPHKMSAVTKGSSTSISLMHVEWTALIAPANGNSNILSYNLVWDNNSGVVDQELTGVSTYFTSTSFEITEGIVEGRDYLFKVRALNIYGWSAYSDVVAIRASEVPQQPDIVTTSIVGSSVRITFTEPDGKGDTITAYKVLVKQSDDTFSEHQADCDASMEPVLTNLYCDVPMSVLRGSPYNLGLGDLVKAKVMATNAVGDSEYSQENTSGVVVETVPGSIMTLRQDLTSQSLDWIVLAWDALTTQEETGGTAISNYRVRWN